MSISPSVETRYLADARLAIDEYVSSVDSEDPSLALYPLEVVAARLGGFHAEEYWSICGLPKAPQANRAQDVADKLLQGLKALPYHPSLALCALAQAPLPHGLRRQSGSYYTDFRLAQFAAKGVCPTRPDRMKIVDPSAGTGVLLVAAILDACGEDRELRSRMIEHSIHAADVSALALRGLRLAVSSLTSDLRAVSSMLPRLRLDDSLLEGETLWSDSALEGFDLVIGNPPWEKLKITRHEHLQGNGVQRHYGAEYDESTPMEAWASDREDLREYLSVLNRRYLLQGRGEGDLYRLFLELSLRLAGNNGTIVLLLPASLIRTASAEPIRKALVSRSGRLEVGIFENRARFFAIDSRFKFLVVRSSPKRRGAPRTIELSHCAATGDGAFVASRAKLPANTLARLNPSLAIPEVKTADDWRMLKHMFATGWTPAAGDNWEMSYSRELDMTNDRMLFTRCRGDGDLALLEGRMVHQFRHNAKRYISGTGRSAVWEVQLPGRGETKPQFWVSPSRLPDEAVARSSRERFGFCDITGQTNERSMLAARVPAGVVCGNKVPTLTFGSDDDTNHRLGFLWLAAVNSIAFDWMLRRWVTTTVNWFILQSLPLPPIEPEGLVARRLHDLSKRLSEALSAGPWNFEASWRVAGLRAEIDARVLHSYRLTHRELELMFRDFPLVDRHQPPLLGEARSTVTHDLLLLTVLELEGEQGSEMFRRLSDRVGAAMALGASPYTPSEFADRYGEFLRVKLDLGEAGGSRQIGLA